MLSSSLVSTTVRLAVRRRATVAAGVSPLNLHGVFSAPLASSSSYLQRLMATEATKSEPTAPVDPKLSSAASASVSTPTSAEADAVKPPLAALASMPNLRNIEMQSLSTPEEEEILNEKLEDLILPSSVFEIPFPKIVDIPDDDATLTPFQRGLKQVMKQSEVKDEIKLQWDPKEKFLKKPEKDEEIEMTAEEWAKSVGFDIKFFDTLPKDKKEAEMALVEYLLAQDLEGTKWNEPAPTVDFDKLLNEVEEEQEKAQKELKEMMEKKARGEQVVEEPTSELFKNCDGDPKKMFQKLIDANLEMDPYGLPKFYQDRPTPLASDMAELTSYMNEIAPHVNIYNTYIKGMMQPLDKATKKIEKYTNWRKTRLTKIIESKRAKKAKAEAETAKTKEQIKVGLLPNAMRYVRSDDPNKEAVNDFAYAIGFNNRWSEEAKKSLIEKYSALLASPQPSGRQWEEFLAMEKWRTRTPEQKEADFEEIYNEEVRQNEGKQPEDS